MWKNMITLFASAAVCAVGNTAEPAAREIVNQDFESKEVFSAISPSGYTLSKGSPDGQWGRFHKDGLVCITEEQAASGSRSLQYTAPDGKVPYYAYCNFPAPLTGSFEMEMYVNHEEGARFIVGLVSRTSDNRNSRIINVGIFDNNYNWAFNDADGKWKRSGIKCPANEWFKLIIKYDRPGNTCDFSVIVDDEEEKIGTFKLPGEIVSCNFLEFRQNASQPGSKIFLDCVKIIEVGK